MKKFVEEMTASEAIIAGGESLLDSLAKGQPLTRRTVSVTIRPRAYSGKDVRSLRRKLNASQALLAYFLGVSPVTLQSWEQGKRKPSPIARRFMDELSRNPAYFNNRLAESISVKVA